MTAAIPDRGFIREADRITVRGPNLVLSIPNDTVDLTLSDDELADLIHAQVTRLLMNIMKDMFTL